jgi:hypothetical protein
MPLPLSASIAKIAAATLDKKAVGLGALLGHWEHIVGKEIAAAAVPIKLARPEKEGPATLYLAVSPARALEVQHDEPILIARINGFFGYKAVGALRLSQRHLNLSSKRKPKRSPGPLAESSLSDADIEARVSVITDPELKETLARLGRSMRKSGVAR